MGLFSQFLGSAQRCTARGTRGCQCLAPRRSDSTSSHRALAHIKLFAEVIADLDDQRDAFGIAGFGDGRLVGRGAEFPGTAVTKNGNHDPVRAVGVNLQFRPSHRDEFGFGLGGLAHDGGFLRAVVLPQVAASAGDCREDDPGPVPRYLAASARVNPIIRGKAPVETGSLFTVSGDTGALAVASGNRVFISRRNPSSVSTLAAILAIRANSALLAATGLLAVSKAARSVSPLINGAYFSRKRARPMASSASEYPTTARITSLFSTGFSGLKSRQRSA